VDEQRFDQVVDVTTGAVASAMPNVDTAVVELDPAGRPVAAADVLLDQSHPRGIAADVDANLAADVRWTHWSNSLWASGGAGAAGYAGDPKAPVQFMTPYPASVFKLMVAFELLRLVDRKQARLDEEYSWSGGVCPAGEATGTHPLSWWLDAMITYSDNHSACALVRLLEQRDALDTLNATLQGLGLSSLRLLNVNTDGGGWSFDGVTMTSLDTARLLLLFTEAPGVLWHTPAGIPVTHVLLSPGSRRLMRSLLEQQGLNQALSRANWCGQASPPAGIPQLVAKRWIAPKSGLVAVHGRIYAGDVRSCNRYAQVEFAHKTGLTLNAGADVGIVTALPGAAPRHYVVAVFSNLGCRLIDASAVEDGGCHYTAKLATLGAGIDKLMTYAAARTTAELEAD
jgi:hypothetical protein